MYIIALVVNKVRKKVSQLKKKHINDESNYESNFKNMIVPYYYGLKNFNQIEGQ